MKFVLSLFAAGLCAHFLGAQSTPDIPLNERVMVVYNAAADESHRVAKYYMEKRAIPKVNLCKIDTDYKETIEDPTRFEPEVKKPLRACLTKIGKDKILYIVFSFQTPFTVSLEGQQLAIDQVVSDIWDEFAGPTTQGRVKGDQPYFGKAESQGNIYEPFVSFAKYRQQPNAKTIYSVWRLDGATAATAEGLVDKALLAEEKGLQGKAYFDIKSEIAAVADKGYGAGDWDIFRSSQMAKNAGFDVTLDSKETEFGTAPSQLRCENAALYAGWYSLHHYNDAFTWVPGAIGFHLDSASASNPRFGPSWVAGALQRGITVTSGSVTEPYLEGLVHPDQIFLYLFQGANVGDAVFRGTKWIKWMILNLGDPLYRPFPKGAGEYGSTTPHPEAWFGISPTDVVGSGTVRAQFSMVEKRDKTVPVIMKSNYPSLVTLPNNATIPPEANGAQFQIPVKSPEQAVSVTITITAGNESVSNTLSVYPILADLSLSQPSMKSDGTVTGTVSSMVPATGPGFTVKLTSSQASVIVPEEVKIPAGAAKVSFPISGKPIDSELTAIITAKIDNASKTAQLKITP